MTYERENKEMDLNDEDKRLKEDLLQLVDQLMDNDEKAMPRALNHLRLLIQTSTTSMTSVPKPLKYLRNSYEQLKAAYAQIKKMEVKVQFAEILSVLAIVGASSDSRECLKYCLYGYVKNPGEWGHEYVKRLEIEIVDEWTNAPIKDEREIRKRLTPLIKSILNFNVKHNAEIQACDLCLEIDRLELIYEHLDTTNYSRVCHYLMSSAAYSEDTERRQVLEILVDQYLRFKEYCKATLIALQLADSDRVFQCFTMCTNPLIQKQLAFLLARQKSHLLRKEYEGDNVQDIETILSNVHVNAHFQMLTRELDILEPKLPEDIYKTWLESNVIRQTERDSAKANLAASFVTGFVHAGFGQDKLMANTENCWVYKNKDHGMLSATASLGLIHMWDVDGGLVPIDKYLYASDDYVKSGALLAIGLVNCGVRNECDPALALLSDYISSKSETLKIGTILGLGLAYAGSHRNDVTQCLMEALTDKQNSMKTSSLAAIGIGLVNVGSTASEASSAILQKVLEFTPEELAITYFRFFPLALGMIYMGSRDAIEALSAALEVLPEPHRLASQTMLQICAYAGTGDVLIVQELLRICSESVNGDSNVYGSLVVSSVTNCCTAASKKKTQNDNNSNSKDNESSKEIDDSQAIATLGVAVVGLGEGKENSRIFTQIGRYGSTAARRAVPLAMALSSLSNPEMSILDVLNKYSHDNDAEVAHNAIFALGLVGAGSNNARLAIMLRQLAAYHAKNPSHLFLVRIAQGLVHLGKGTLSLCPLHYASKVLDQTALAGLLIVLVACLDCRNLILAKSHYLLYCLAVAMEPRWLITLDEELKVLPVSVRIGQAVDVIGKAGNPKSIAGGHVHTTPTLLVHGEKAELVLDEYEPLSSILEGFIILRKKITS